MNADISLLALDEYPVGAVLLLVVCLCVLEKIDKELAGKKKESLRVSFHICILAFFYLINNWLQIMKLSSCKEEEIHAYL